MVDFGARPPEVNSALIYAGPGSSSLQAAASSWNGIAAELSSAATAYDKVVTQLVSDEWMGPASTSMAAAAQQHVSWMSTAAAQAEQAALQARMAAAAYEQALTSSIPPPLVAANRAETAAATQANVFGQYTPLIMQLEAQYAEFWAQDAAAMYTYAGQSAAAAKVTPFASPAATTTPAAQGLQAAAVSQAGANSAATSTQTILQELLAILPSNIQSLLTPTGFQSAFGSPASILSTLYSFIFGTTVLPTNLSAFISAYSPYASFFYNTEGLPYFSVGMGNFGVQMAKTLGMLGGAAPAAAGGAAAGGLGGLGGMLGGGASSGAAAAAGPGVAAGLGGAGAVGKLAVPPSWIGGAPLAAPHAPLPVSSVSAAPEGAGAGNLLGGMPLAGAGGGGIGGSGPRYGFKPTVMSRPPFAG